jgi:transforming growth factor-beta-induced protein
LSERGTIVEGLYGDFGGESSSYYSAPGGAGNCESPPDGVYSNLRVIGPGARRFGSDRRRLQIRRGFFLNILDDPDRNFTLFAPTNNAFQLLPQELLQLLYLRDAFVPHLEDLLRYHALNEERFSDQFLANETIPSLNTERIQVGLDPFLVVNGIRVVRRNIDASNGVTHVINGVLKPDWVDNSILAFVTMMDDLSILFDLLERAGLADKLDQFGDEFTFVAPTNDAFNALGNTTLATLRDPENQQALVDILEYHIIIGVIALSELSLLQDGASLLTEQGGSIVVSIIEVANITAFMFNQATVVSSGSILANNGVLYKIDAVLNIPD